MTNHGFFVSKSSKSRSRKNRRDVLRMTAAGSLALSWGMPKALARLSQATPQQSDRILVVYQFSGGNDGLSTVVPHGIDAYYNARPKLAIPSTAWPISPPSASECSAVAKPATILIVKNRAGRRSAMSPRAPKAIRSTKCWLWLLSEPAIRGLEPN